MLFFLETERARVGDQVDPQAQEVLHNSSTDSCLTFPYSSDSPDLFHLLLYIMSLYLQKEFLTCPLSPTILPLTMLLLTVLLFMLLPYLSHLLFPSSDLPELTLLFFYLPLLVLTTLFSILLISLDLFLKQVPQCSLEFLPSLLISDLHFLTLSLCLLHPCLPWSLSVLYLPPSPLVSFSQILDLDPPGGQSRFPELPFLGEGELPGAEEEVELLPLPAVRPLPSPATFGLIFNPAEPFLEVPLLMVLWT